MRKVWTLLMAIILTITVIPVIIDIVPNATTATTWYVDDILGGSPPEDFISIQDAVNASQPGDNVFIYGGIYNENVVINKSINLTGEDKYTTIINAGGSGDAVQIIADYVNITNFTVTGSGFGFGDAGIELDNVYNCSITKINISMNWDGISLLSSHNNFIINNSFTNNTMYGIYLSLSNGNNITENTMIKNGVFISGNLENWISHNIDTSNTVNSKPIYYWKNRINGVVPAGAGQVILANCSNVTIANQELSKGTVGIEVGFSINNNISHNNVSSNNRYGIYLHYSDKNLLINNTCLLNQYNGISIWNSHENIIKSNNISENDNSGMKLQFSNNNIMENNNIFSNIGDGISLQSSNNMIRNNAFILNTASGIGVNSNENIIDNNSCFGNQVGITLWDSFINIIGNNSYSNNDYGIYLFSSENNTIFQNNVSINNINGIWLDSSSNNIVYHNNIINNAVQAIDNTNNRNQWDNGYPSGGNFWSDYIDIDNFKGSNQDIPGSDGIWDHNYSIDMNSKDNYPLAYPFIKHSIYLLHGWNLISIPFIQSNNDLGIVLSSISGFYNAIQWYNISDTSDPWKHNHTSKPSHLNDLDDIDHKRGFWIYITAVDGILFEYFGSQPKKNQSITLYPGWNLVGYPSLSNKSRDVALNNVYFGLDVNSIWTYDSLIEKWEELDSLTYFKIGQGYWVYSNVEKVWDVPL